MLTNFDKAQQLEKQAALIDDPVLKKKAYARIEQYYGLDLKESSLQIKRSKPHYAYMRVLWPTLLSAVLLFAAVAGVAHFFPTIPLATVGWCAGGLLFAVATINFFARGKLSESGYVALATTLNPARQSHSIAANQDSQTDSEIASRDDSA